MIVGDAYQRRGIGTRLLRRLLKPSERLACREIVATVVAGNAPMLHIFDASGPDWVRDLEQGVLTLRAPLPGPGQPSPRRITAASSPETCSRPGTHSPTRSPCVAQ